MKLFKVPINHPYIQGLTSFDLEFIELSTLWDDPKIREKLQNTFYDDEYDDWEQEIQPLSPEEEALFNAQKSTKNVNVESNPTEGVFAQNLTTEDDYSSLESTNEVPTSDEWEEDE